MHQVARTARAGFSLVEMLVGMTLLAVVLSVSVPFFSAQSGAVTKAGGRMDALQNSRFAVDQIDRELRMAGAGVVDAQPMLVQAATSAITFNSNLSAHDSSDKGAVYYDPDQDILSVVSLTKTAQITLPLSSARYPDTSYTQGSGGGATPSLAETISYWAALDSSTSRTDDYLIWRRVNDRTPQVVIRSVVVPSGTPIFRYFKNDTLGHPVEIPQAQLPLIHSSAIHGAPADSAKSALTDSVTFVRVHVVTVYKDRKAGDMLRPADAGIRIANSGLIQHATCGDPPILGAVLTAVPTGGATPKVTLTWARASDEAGGEKDVERYVLYRRAPAATSFSEPLAGLSAGLLTYQYVDTQVSSGQSWVYGVAAQDCTPANSPIAMTATIVIP